MFRKNIGNFEFSLEKNIFEFFFRKKLFLFIKFEFFFEKLSVKM